MPDFVEFSKEKGKKRGRKRKEENTLELGLKEGKMNILVLSNNIMML